jgi:hypothetical protein
MRKAGLARGGAGADVILVVEVVDVDVVDDEG